MPRQQERLQAFRRGTQEIGVDRARQISLGGARARIKQPGEIASEEDARMRDHRMGKMPSGASPPMAPMSEGDFSHSKRNRDQSLKSTQKPNIGSVSRDKLFSNK